MNKKILIVDDEVDIIEPLQLLLEYEGYQVAATSKAEEIYSKIKEFQPDAILLDILLSGNDGRTICKALKEGDKSFSIPVILMSAHPTAQADSLKSGADGFLAKPFDTTDLYTALKKVFSK